MSSFLNIGNKKAVIVGINQYEDNGIDNLKYSVADVKSLTNILTDPNRGGYFPEDIRLLIDGDQEPTRSNILSSITSLATSASSEDSILFYFSGHGIEEGGEGYLLSRDSKVNVMKTTAIPIESIKKTLVESTARAKIIILDACHSGALIGKAESGRMTKGFYDSIFPAPEGFAILSSCKMNEVSYEWAEKEHSVFSFFLLEGLEGLADKDNDGKITITEANSYTYDKVKTWGFRNQKQQSPTLKCEISGDIIFVNTPEQQFSTEEIPIDKSMINKIILKRKDIGKIELSFSKSSAIETAIPKYLNRAHQICGILLTSVDSNEIQAKEDNSFHFPCGVITMNYNWASDTLDFWLELSFDYNKKCMKSVDNVISNLDGYSGWEALRYELRSKLDFSFLIKKCIKQGFTINSYDPMPPGSLNVSVEGWGSNYSTVTFKNEEKTAKIVIYPQHGSFHYEFYETINPENIITYLQE